MRSEGALDLGVLARGRASRASVGGAAPASTPVIAAVEGRHQGLLSWSEGRRVAGGTCVWIVMFRHGR